LKIYLASESPRRRQLLTQAGIAHTVMPSGADEDIACDLPPEQFVQTLALRKAQAVRAQISYECIIIAADTIVYFDGQILGKPADEAQAFDMLSRLQGNRHTVYTGVAMLCSDKQVVFAEQADVYFRALDDETIRRYIATGEPMDKAGAYGIQEKGSVLVTRVEGDFYTVMGLPIARVCMVLESEWGLRAFALQGRG
jgi:septum formation protein